MMNFKYLGPCHPYEGPRWNSQLLALPGPAQDLEGNWEVNHG